MKRSFKDDFSLMAMLLIPIGVAINIVGFQLTNVLRLPIFLDTIGTILVGVIAGPWVALLAGLITNLINAIFNPVYLPYALTSMAIGVGAGLLSKFGFFKNVPKTIISVIVITLIAVVVSAPITVLVFGGATGNTSSLITATFLASGQQLWTAVFSSSFIVEIADKVVSVLIVFFIVKGMSDRYLSKLKYGHLYMKRRNRS
ncbi:energy-coupling factor transport system substrate-specific component [Planococcus glaciei]|uniref:ECF transporter S component n=1 Tax=Planococcus glaciei TaxID=459472 RepID=UPI00088FDE2D|nr:ECF transporter S component [Planococcus glaciei]SDH82738.1 energy-coupling factor transport system substrate-specific component [Planococcus glaciei]